MSVTINDNDKISLSLLKKKKGAKNSTLIANGLPTGVVEKHYDIKLTNIQQIIQRKRSSGNVISNKYRSVKCVSCQRLCARATKTAHETRLSTNPSEFYSSVLNSYFLVRKS